MKPTITQEIPFKVEAKAKLKTITQIWNDFIWDYQFCQKQIRFDDDQKSNYFEDILTNFKDTFVVLDKKVKLTSFYNIFENTVSFLQCVYVQQDFVEEMHFIFKTNTVKGDLKKDENYFINRDIRNETVGHPIRKTKIPKKYSEEWKRNGKKQNEVFFSSIIFSNDNDGNNICYLKYSRENGFKAQHLEYKRIDILTRHYQFLSTNFDKIIFKLKKALKSFSKEIEKIEKTKDSITLEELIRVVSLSFNYILESDPLFNPETLLKLEKNKDKHQRYKNALDIFYNDLKNQLQEKKQSIEELISEQDQRIDSNSNLGDVEINLPQTMFVNGTNHKSTPSEQNRMNFDYELGKLGDPKNKDKTDYGFEMLKDKCENMPEVLLEIEHMKKNITNPLEYYSSYKLLSQMLESKNKT